MPEADFVSLQAQMSRGMAAVLAQRGGAVSLRLQPEALGELRVRLDWERGAVSVRFVAGSERARELLEHALPGLRASLEARGLEVERVAVEPPPVPHADSGHAATGNEDGGGGRQYHTGEPPTRSAAGETSTDSLGPEAGADLVAAASGIWAEPDGHGDGIVRLRIDARA